MWAWLRRFRPCRPRETLGSFAVVDLQAQLSVLQRRYDELAQMISLEKANRQQSDSSQRAQLDEAVRNADNLRDLVRDIRELTKREGL